MSTKIIWSFKQPVKKFQDFSLCIFIYSPSARRVSFQIILKLIDSASHNNPSHLLFTKVAKYFT